jgi:xylulokinase
MHELVVGIDIGTSGIRAVACDASGHVWASAQQPLTSQHIGAAFEQDPAQWWQAAVFCLRSITDQLALHQTIIRAVSVAATSGTLCLLDSYGQALRPALMYADSRAIIEAAILNQQGADLCARLGYQFHSSWGLPKLLWLARHEPAHVASARFVAHAGDVLTGHLCGDFAVTDATQALKSGYDLLAEQWPDWISTALELPIEKLPRVVRSGSCIGVIGRSAAQATGLAPGVAVIAGMTDGCAAQVAAGAVLPGQWLSVLGTTLVLKGVSVDLLRDPVGRVYSHRHPNGYWLPSAASNSGGEALARWSPAELARYDAKVFERSPTNLLCYPLQRQGERFPFVEPTAQGFLQGTPDSDVDYYAACLEGVAYIERLGYELLESLGAQADNQILTTGGGAKSQVWNQIRADVLQRPLGVVAALGADVGAAIIAATSCFYPDLQTATRAMSRVQMVVEPRLTHLTAYGERYQRFVAACRAYGYLDLQPVALEEPQ